MPIQTFKLQTNEEQQPRVHKVACLPSFLYPPLFILLLLLERLQTFITKPNFQSIFILQSVQLYPKSSNRRHFQIDISTHFWMRKIQVQIALVRFFKVLLVLCFFTYRLGCMHASECTGDDGRCFSLWFLV